MFAIIVIIKREFQEVKVSLVRRVHQVREEAKACLANQVTLVNLDKWDSLENQ